MIPFWISLHLSLDYGAVSQNICCEENTQSWANPGEYLCFFQIFLCNSRPNRAVYLMEYFKKTTKTGHFSWPIKMLHPCSSLKLKTGNVTLANSGSCCGITTDLL